MPMPTRWTKEARQSILDMMQRGVSREEIESTVGVPWPHIWNRLVYHGRLEALERRRQLDPAYTHLTVRGAPSPQADNAIEVTEEEIVTETEQRAIDALYAPRIPIPEAIMRAAERRKKYG